jgi:hypothetical protein
VTAPARTALLLSTATALLVAAAPTRAEFPENAVAAFCEADGRGDRIRAERAAELAALSGGRFEPAWDRLFLVSGFEVTPVLVTAEEAEIAVRYTVVAEVSGEGVDDRERIETVRLRLHRGGAGWRLRGPLPPPHLFTSAFEAEDLFRLLAPLGPEYVSNSKFVWQMLQNAGWSLPYQPARSFLTGGYLRAVAEPAGGDVVAYLSSGVPYHVGLYVGEDTVASATVNAGLVRTPLNGFPGEVRYLRLTEAARPPAPTEETPTAGSPPAEDPE